MLTDMIERCTTTPSAGQRRAIALNLVVFFIFALTAVVMLTRTAIAANAINRDVASTVEPAVGNINQETSQLAVLDVAARVTGQVAAAAKPLSGHLDGVLAATDNINGNLASTRDSVTRIGTSVDGIKGSTGAIRPAVGVLSGRVDTIHSQARGIAGSLSTVAKQSSSMVKGLSRTNASLGNILAAARHLNAVVRGIQARVPQINAHARNIAKSPVLLRTSFDLAWVLKLFGGN